MEKAIATMIAKHRAQDDSLIEPEVIDKEKKHVAKLKKQAAKIKEWLEDKDDQHGFQRQTNQVQYHR
jgi:hypothetical protein